MKTRIFLPLALASIAAFVGFASYEGRRQADEQARGTLRVRAMAQREWRQLLATEARLLQAEIAHLAANRQLLDQWHRRDLDTLNQVAQPIYSKLRQDFNVTHCYFVEPDRTCFLRAHHPPRRGDIIDRHTMKTAAQTGKDSWGIELGPLGTFTLRYVRPWVVDGRLCGYLELGKEIEPLTTELARSADCQVISLVDKQYTTREKFENGRQVINLAGRWSDFPNVAVLNQTIPNLPPAVASYIADNGVDGTGVFDAQLHERRFSCTQLGVPDAAGRPVAGLVLMRDVTSEYQTARAELWSTLALAAVAMGLLLALTWVAVVRTERRLRSALDARIAAENRQRASELNLDITLDSIADGVITTDAQGRVQRMNPVAEQMTGWSQALAVDRELGGILNIVDARTDTPLIDPALQVLTEQQIVTGPEYAVLVSASGGLRYVAYNAAPIRVRADHIDGVVLVLSDISEQYSAREELLKQTRLLRTVIDGIPDVVALQHPDHSIIFYNRAGYEFLGKTPAEVDGRKCFETLGQDQPCVGCGTARACGTKKVVQVEKHLEHLDRTLEVRSIPILDDSGEVVLIVEVLRDITERKRSENALKEQETFLQTLMESLALGVLVIDAETHRIEMINPAAAAMFDVTADQAVGETCFGYFCARGAEHCPVTEDGATVENVEQDILRDDGTRLPVLKWVRRVVVNGREKLLECFTDISERKQAEIDLRRALDEQEAIFDSSLVGIMVLENRILTKVNRRMADMLGYQPEEMVGRGPEQLHLSHENFLEFGEKYYWRLAEHQIVQIEYPLRHKNGHTVWCQFNGMAIDPPDLANGAVWIIDDITERKRAEEERTRLLNELEQTNRHLETANARTNTLMAQAEMASVAKSEFLANMSHEIRTPMTAILGYIDVIREGCPGRCTFGADNMSRCLDIVHRNGQHLLQIINDILDISKIEAGKLEVQRVQCSPIQVVSDVQSLMQVRADQGGIYFKVDYTPPIPALIDTDPTRLKQILVNLVGNAIKFTERGGVTLRIRMCAGPAPQTDPPAEQTMQFEIIDTGIGMAPQQLANLFQPFTQGDSSTSRRFGGTGLGLMISKRLATQLGGDISVTSQPGRGSTFTVTIATGPLTGVRMLDDLSEAGSFISREHPDTADKIELSCRILLAEDGEDNQRLISYFLRKAHADVDVANNGQVAVESVAAAEREGQPFDVVLMDMQMPIMDGYTATRTLRHQGYAGPIIALTAHAMNHDRQKCLDAGCNDYASKPIDRQKLLALIAQHVQYSQTRTTCV